MILNKDFREFIQSLNDNEVKYLVVDGYAVAFHGYPRHTRDIDIWIWLDQVNAENLTHSIIDFGFESLDLKLEDFLDPDQVIQLGYPPNRIDLIFYLDGIQFQECYQQKVEVNIEGTRINFIDLKNLKKNKKATGRYQDLADLEHLE